jgi:hypothetical protein
VSTTDEENRDFETRLQHLLREEAESLDARTRSRLTRARHRAIAALADEPAWRLGMWLPAGTAAAAVLAVALWFAAMESPERGVGTAAATLEDLDILTAEDSLDLIENWEFYRWIEDEPDVG